MRGVRLQFVARELTVPGRRRPLPDRALGTLRLVTDDSLASHEFALFGDEEPPRRTWSRAISSLLVVLVHLVFLAMFAISVTLPAFHRRTDMETILLLPSLDGRNSPQVHMLQPKSESPAPPEIVTAPITLPKPPPPPQNAEKPLTPGDVLRAVGEDLSCQAGSFENLTQNERNHCRHEPWRAARAPNGSLVLQPTMAPKLVEPPPEFRISGAEAQRRALQSSPTGCPVLLNIPCLNNIPHDNN